MTVYMLFEKQTDGSFKMWEYASAIWLDFDKLTEYLSSYLIKGEDLSMEQTASNSWIVNDKFKIIETITN